MPTLIDVFIDTIIDTIAIALPNEDITNNLKAEIRNSEYETPPGTEGYDIVHHALDKLHHQGKLSGDQYNILNLAVETAKISRNNKAIVQAVVEASNPAMLDK